jgi:coenzyme F420-reducing hydrogenase beta subunit
MMPVHTFNSRKPSAGLFETVVSNGYCVGCGACAAFDPSIRLALDVNGRYVAVRADERSGANPAAGRVCPFADGVPNENELAREVFGPETTFESHVGCVIANYAGWVVESDYRVNGSSGGMATWLLVELLNRGLIDHVVHVAPQSTVKAGMPLFGFAISSTPEEVYAKSKSRYYPVEMSGVMTEMLQRPGRYAVVGIPCFTKAVRLACRESPILRQRVTYIVGIVCGHLKSTAFAEMCAWQCGIAPNELRGIDFRTKLPDRPASHYGVTVWGEKNGTPVTVTKPTSELFGSDWGYGFFKYKACDFCDDVVGETADISIGDAWLPEYVSDSAGMNVIVVRSQALNSMLTEAAESGRLHLDAIPVEKVVASQAGGFRHRREGLAYRLHLEDQAGRWRPTKRVAPSAGHLSRKLRAIYSLRYELGQFSHVAFAAAKATQDFSVFAKAMEPLTSRYDRHYRRTLVRRALEKIERALLAVCQIPHTLIL